MAKTIPVVLALTVSSTVLLGCRDHGEVWVANRGAGTISVLGERAEQPVSSIILPDGGEPMYINYGEYEHSRRVFVGDRANDRVVVYDADTHEVETFVAAGAGVFHQWVSAEQLWVNNDIDKTTSVIDARSLAPLATVPMPADLAAMGGKPHDVFLDPDGGAAFVSYLGFDGEDDYVVRFDRETFTETHRAPVGKDPHLSATITNDLLYVPCQESDEVVLLSRDTLERVGSIPVPGAHGAIMSPDGAHFYTTNLPGGGAEALFVIDTQDNDLVSDTGVDAPATGAPHNLAVNDAGTRLFLTHSGGAAKTLSVFTTEDPAAPEFLVEIEVQENPFGLAYIPRGDDLGL